MSRLPRRLVRVALCIAGLSLPSVASAQDLKVTLLGTGGPEPALDRFGPATLVEAGNEKLLFDAGRGASQRLWQLGIRLGDVRAVFLTHLHSDHIVGLPDVWLASFQATRFGGRTAPLEVWGPGGTSDMLDSLRKAYLVDLRNRREGAGLSDAAVGLSGHDLSQGVVYERNGLRVTAFTVDHGAVAIPSFGYRVDSAGRSVVISGDTRPSDNLVRFAQGVDVLIHEVMHGRPAALQQSESLRRIMSSHTSPEDAGAIFARAKPKLAVFTHIGVLAGAAARDAVTAEILPRARSHHSGSIELGEDLMTILIGDTVTVRRPGQQSAR